MEHRPLIEFRGVVKAFDDTVVLDGVDLSIYQGQVTTLFGKSGVGKSVLFKHIIGLLTPEKGTVFFRGKPIAEMSKSERHRYIGKISYMFQNNALFDSLTVFENIALPLRQGTKLSHKEIKGKVCERIEQTELTEVPHKYVSELSGGMQKRVALARALVTDPEIVLFDEPTTGQDPIRRNAIMSIIASYQQRFGFTAVLISHDFPDVFFISNRILALDRGKIIFQGTPEEFDQFEHPFVDEFIESLEGFQEHLTGLHSKRAFKVRYQKSLAKKHAPKSFGVAAFSIHNLELLSQNVGHETAQAVIQALGTYINKHFGSVGGFSMRQGSNLFVTVLPFSDLRESKEIFLNFGQDLREHGLSDIRADARILQQPCFEFFVSGGLAEGQAGQGMESIIELASSRRKTIAVFRCQAGGEET